jgi:hypothetical protein
MAAICTPCHVEATRVGGRAGAWSGGCERLVTEEGNEGGNEGGSEGGGIREKTRKKREAKVDQAGYYKSYQLQYNNKGVQ